MEGLNEFFIEYGYIGMAMAAFLAGSVMPFSSEAVMGALLAMSDMDPWLTVLSGTLGNVGGAMLNYYIGRVAKTEQICKWMKIKERRLERAKRFVMKHGSWIALFTFLPVLGEGLSIALGMLRANVVKVLLFTTIGKFVRYVIVAYTVVALKG